MPVLRNIDETSAGPAAQPTPHMSYTLLVSALGLRPCNPLLLVCNTLVEPPCTAQHHGALIRRHSETPI